MSDSLLAPLDTIIAQNPREPVYRTVQLRTLQMLRRDDRLRDAFEKWVRAVPRDPAPYREYARVLIQLGRPVGGGQHRRARARSRSAACAISSTRMRSFAPRWATGSRARSRGAARSLTRRISRTRARTRSRRRRPHRATQFARPWRSCLPMRDRVARSPSSSSRGAVRSRRGTRCARCAPTPARRRCGRSSASARTRKSAGPSRAMRSSRPCACDVRRSSRNVRPRRRCVPALPPRCSRSFRCPSGRTIRHASGASRWRCTWPRSSRSAARRMRMRSSRASIDCSCPRSACVSRRWSRRRGCARAIS